MLDLKTILIAVWVVQLSPTSSTIPEYDKITKLTQCLILSYSFKISEGEVKDYMFYLCTVCIFLIFYVRTISEC